MNEMTRQAELLKLARILDTPESALDFLADADVETLRTIRKGVTDALFAKFRPSFSAFARMSTRLPVVIAAKIAERALGATLSGRIAGEMPPVRALEMAARLTDEFLADTCLQMEPRRTEAIISRFPVARAVAITRILLARGEYITMGRFVDVLPRATLLAATDAIDDAADLLHIGFFVENADQLDCVIAHLSDARRAAVIRTAAQQGYWPEVVVALMRIGIDSRRALAEDVLAQDDDTLDSLIGAAAANDLWPALFTIGSELAPAAGARLADQPAFNEPHIVYSVIDSVQRHALWPALDHQLETMGAQRIARLLSVAVAEDPAFLAAMAARELPEGAAAENLQAAAGLLDQDVRARAVAACGESRLATLLAAEN